MKKILLLMLGVLLTFPTFAQTFEYEYEGNTLKYSVVNWIGTVVDVVGVATPSLTNSDLIIPEIVYDDNQMSYQVAHITTEAFMDCTDMTSIIIPNTITAIGERAFYGCNNLTKAEFASIESLCSIYYLDPFANPLAITKHLYIDGEEITNLVIPDSVSYISDYAFCDCTSLTSVIIPESASEFGVGKYAFSGCTGLIKSAYPNTISNPFPAGISISYNPSGAVIEDGFIYGPDKSSILFAPYYLEGEYTVPNTVSFIGRVAFSGCRYLTSVIIPVTVTEIGYAAFDECYGLIKSAYPNTLADPFDPYSNGTAIAYNPNGAVIEDGIIYGPDKSSILFVPLSFEGEYVVPNTVIEIGDWAFYQCRDMTSVRISNSVYTIGENAFRYCSGLTSVILPSSIKSIGSNAFEDCRGLKKTAYPNTLTKPFRNLIAIGYPINAVIEDGYIYGPDRSSILFVPLYFAGEYIVPNYVTYIGRGAFYGCSGLTSVAIPNSVAEIVDYAFCECNNLVKAEFESIESLCDIKFGSFYANPLAAAHHLYIGGEEVTEVVIPTSVSSIKSHTFDGFSALTSVTIPRSVTEISSGAFYSCSGLTSLEIPNSITSIGYQAFAQCNGLKSVYYGAEKPIEGDESIFSDETYQKATLYLTENGVKLSGSISPWKNFVRKQAYEFPAGVEEISADINSEEPYEVYDLRGLKVADSIEALTPGIYIVRQGNVTKKIRK